MGSEMCIRDSINYRLAPRVRMPTQLDDCRRAVVWMKRNAERFGGDPNFIVLGGESAGGHLASLVALTARQQVEAGGADTCVQGTSAVVWVWWLRSQTAGVTQAPRVPAGPPRRCRGLVRRP